MNQNYFFSSGQGFYNCTGNINQFCQQDQKSQFNASFFTRQIDFDTDNKENYNQNLSNFSFLSKKAGKGGHEIQEDNEQSEKVRNKLAEPKHCQNSSKKIYGSNKKEFPLKEINFNGLKNFNRKLGEDGCGSILQMAIMEKNAFDMEEKEKKKNHKIQIIKMHQRSRHLQQCGGNTDIGSGMQMDFY